MLACELDDADRCVECGRVPRRGVEVDNLVTGWEGIACWPCLRRNRRRVGPRFKEREI